MNWMNRRALENKGMNVFPPSKRLEKYNTCTIEKMDVCDCRSCVLFYSAQDFVQEKNTIQENVDILKANGFSEDDARNQVEIFEDIGYP